jgi:DNA polymerase I
MSVFLNFLKKSFDRVLICDSEFRYADETKTVIEKVVCFVYKDLFTGDKFYFWEADKELSHPHFDYQNVLVIPFNAVAEAHAWLQLLHGKPINCWDTYVENIRLYKTKRSGPGALGLLSTAHAYGINQTMTKEQKDEERDLIIKNKTYTKEQRARILKYCLDDVELTEKVFRKQIADIEKKNKLLTDEDCHRELSQIMFRGYSQLNIAQVERNGIPFDVPMVQEFNTYWPLVKDHLVKKYNELINVFDENGTEKNELFEAMIKRNGLFANWKRTFNSGSLVKDLKYVKKFSDYPDIANYIKIKYFLNLNKLSSLQPGFDGKSRVAFNMFGSETGRCQPSSSKFVFGGPKWIRNFIKPSWGNSRLSFRRSKINRRLQKRRCLY